MQLVVTLVCMQGSTSCRSCSSVAQVGQPAEPPPLASEATSGADTTSGGESSGGKGIAAWVIALVTCVLGLLIALLGGIIVMQLRRKDRDKGNTLATASRVRFITWMQVFSAVCRAFLAQQRLRRR